MSTSTPGTRKPGPRLHRLTSLAAVSVALLSLHVRSAQAASGSKAQGAALMTQVESGQLSCSGLSSGDFSLIGRYGMDQIMGSVKSLNAMNAEMRTSMGSRNEVLGYRFMGQRLAGCATGNGPVSFGTMMGLMGTSEMGASYGSATGSSDGSSMMDGDRSGSEAIGAGVIAAMVLGVLLLLTVILWFMTARTGRPRSRPSVP